MARGRRFHFLFRCNENADFPVAGDASADGLLVSWIGAGNRHPLHGWRRNGAVTQREQNSFRNVLPGSALACFLIISRRTNRANSHRFTCGAFFVFMCPECSPNVPSQINFPGNSIM